MMRKFSLFALVAFLLAVYPTQPGSAAPYSVQALGFLTDHPTSVATDISNNGIVVGVALSGNDISSFLWSRTSGITHPSGVSFHYVAGINNSDQTASWHDFYDESGHLLKSTPYIRNTDGSVTNLADVTGVEHVWLKNIDDAGRVLVSFQNRDSYSGGYAVVDGNGSTLIATPDNEISVEAISNNGNIIVNNKYLWTVAGGASILPWLANAGSVDVTCVNDLGWVAGILNDHVVRWDANGNMTDLGVGYASDINNLGQIVGYINDQAVMWNTDGSAVYLPQLDGYTQAGAAAINEQGQIAGTARISGYQTDMAVVWQPVPEPSAFAALACGLVGILTQTRKRRSP